MASDRPDALPSRSKCDYWPSKVRYRSEHKATRQLARLMQAGMSQARIYRCEHCDGWHTTSQQVRRKTGAPSPLPPGFMALLTLPGHEGDVRLDYRTWREQT